ncbi:MAG TPA: DUF523 and DUF1722 domain-containing protein [Vicinamibacterales bacterium]|jgi:uncharacterized protein YbgA (DUF1722 family)/uncharacterized protein YbbK (DUF523 family)
MATSTSSVRIGISACLIGQKVRFDGGHKRDAFLVDTFGKYVEWVPVCPEVEVGMGTPREAIRLVRPGGADASAAGGGGGIRLVGVKSGTDHTEAMRAFAARRVDALAREDLDGYILKKDSPSCGMERVKVYQAGGAPARTGRGLFAESLVVRLPLLPVEEEGRLSDPHLRDNFVERVFAYRRLRGLFSGRWTVGALVRFHTAHKLTLLAHSPDGYRELGRVVARAASMRRADVKAEYESAFMRALATIATPRRHVNVLQHMLGYFRKVLDDASRAELAEAVADYQRGWVPLIVPVTLLRHHVHRCDIGYLAGQIYLEPHPRELMLRNHV